MPSQNEIRERITNPIIEALPEREVATVADAVAT